MMAVSNTPPQSSPTADNRFSWRTFVLIAMLIVLPFAAPHAPPRLKLIGVFSILVGLAVGVLLGRIGNRFGVSREILRLVAVVIVPLAIVAFEWETARSWQASYREEFIAHVQAQPFGEQLLERVRDGTPAESEMLREMDAVYRKHLHFDRERYLRARGKLIVPVMDEPVQLTPAGARWLIAGEALLAILAGLAAVLWQTRT